MNLKLEEVLILVEWGLDHVVFPPTRYMTFEGWALRNGVDRRLRYLEQKKLIARQRKKNGTGWILKLTDIGRIESLGGKDPAECWDRPWDGEWRMILFDLPYKDKAQRAKLWRWLRANGFGNLQRSVWIIPDNADKLERLWKKAHPQWDVFALIEGHPTTGTDNAKIVRSAWDFKGINQAYQELMYHLESPVIPKELTDTEILEWVTREQQLWNRAIELDPLLPRQLLPEDYLGETALRQREITRKEIREAVQNLTKSP